MLISSKDNKTIKNIRSLSTRNSREKTKLFFIEGIRLLAEAIEVGVHIETIITCPELLTEESIHLLERIQRKQKVLRLEVTPRVLSTLTEKNTSEGICAVLRQHWEQLEDIKPGEELCWIAINSIQCPSNLGTILRISDAVGGAGVILIGHSTDPYHPAAVRSSLGAMFSQHLIRVDFSSFAEWKKKQNFRIIGTSPNDAADYQSINYEPPMILLLGNEWSGLPIEQQSLCDAMVKIPMLGRIESHNVAVAASIVLYEALAQRKSSNNYEC